MCYVQFILIFFSSVKLQSLSADLDQIWLMTGVGKLWPAGRMPEYIMWPVGTYMFARFLKFYSKYIFFESTDIKSVFYGSRIDLIRLSVALRRKSLPTPGL